MPGYRVASHQTGPDDSLRLLHRKSTSVSRGVCRGGGFYRAEFRLAAWRKAQRTSYLIRSRVTSAAPRCCRLDSGLGRRYALRPAGPRRAKGSRPPSDDRSSNAIKFARKGGEGRWPTKRRSVTPVIFRAGKGTKGWDAWAERPAIRPAASTSAGAGSWWHWNSLRNSGKMIPAHHYYGPGSSGHEPTWAPR